MQEHFEASGSSLPEAVRSKEDRTIDRLRFITILHPMRLHVCKYNTRPRNGKDGEVHAR